MLTQVTKTAVCFPDEDLETLRSVGRRTGRSVPDLVREAVRRVWLSADSNGPVALWDGTPTKTPVEHDAIYD
ncbi:MAG: ribbon-helix-helix domain-containing protein [Bryobacterales bacterium]|nr:ribbon-helix-helix domain-containing protein [Bryobacterales bacterium]MDE0620228.1 ribbon-helix-helix domain-containing protein [Bryobacterales bacterium]